MSRLTAEEKATSKEAKRLQKAENRILMLVGFLGGLIFLGLVMATFVAWAIQTGFNLF